MATLQTGTGPNGGVWAVAFNPGGTLLATGDADGTVQLWNLATGRPVATIHATTSSVYGVHAVAFSPDGKLLATGEADGTVRAWDPATRRPVGAPLPTGDGPARRGRSGVQPRRHAAGQRRRRRHRAAVASIAIHLSLCGALRLRGTTGTARMEPVRLRRTAAEGLRLNARTPQRPPPLRQECPAHLGIRSWYQFLTIAGALAVANSVLIGGTLRLAVQDGTGALPAPAPVR